jgi:hypothetical protein
MFDTHSYFPELGSRKHFQASGMRTIDTSHKISPNRVTFEKNFEFKKQKNRPNSAMPVEIECTFIFELFSILVA